MLKPGGVDRALGKLENLNIISLIVVTQVLVWVYCIRINLDRNWEAAIIRRVGKLGNFGRCGQNSRLNGHSSF